MSKLRHLMWTTKLIDSMSPLTTHQFILDVCNKRAFISHRLWYNTSKVSTYVTANDFHQIWTTPWRYTYLFLCYVMLQRQFNSPTSELKMIVPLPRFATTAYSSVIAIS